MCWLRLFFLPARIQEPFIASIILFFLHIMVRCSVDDMQRRWEYEKCFECIGILKLLITMTAVLAAPGGEVTTFQVVGKGNNKVTSIGLPGIGAAMKRGIDEAMNEDFVKIEKM